SSTGWDMRPLFNPKPNNLDRRFRIYRETLSRFSCAASPEGIVNITLPLSVGTFISSPREA
ncbi:hypothetical protein ACTMNS_02830, partial [Staphylococcus haemolyticus]